MGKQKILYILNVLLYSVHKALNANASNCTCGMLESRIFSTFSHNRLDFGIKLLINVNTLIFSKAFTLKISYFTKNSQIFKKYILGNF